MFLRSARLFLRPGWPEDGEELARLNAMGLAAGELPPRPLAVELLDALVPLPALRLFPQLCITGPRTGSAEILGGIGIRPGASCPELAVWIAPPFRGRGYATEAVRAVAALAAALGHRRIVARCDPQEPAIRKVLTRAGFMGLGPGNYAMDAPAEPVAPGRAWHGRAGLEGAAPASPQQPALSAPAPAALHRFTPPQRRHPHRGIAP